MITADPLWQSWSEEQLSRWLDRAPVLINPIVYAEIAFACEAIETVDDLLPAQLYTYRPVPREAAFLAAPAHAQAIRRMSRGQASVALPRPIAATQQPQLSPWLRSH